MKRFYKGLFFLMASVGFADDCQNQDPCFWYVTVESPSYTFETNFTALILQPFANNLSYGAEALPFNYGTALPILSPSWSIPEISTDFHFGFDVGVAAVFSSAKSKLALHWERYHSSKDSNSRTVSTQDMIGPFFEIGPDANPYKVAKGTTKFHLDEVCLDYGTFVRFGDLLCTNLYAGVGFARIVQHRFTTFSNVAATIVRTIDVPARFTGAGPEFGFDFSYRIVKGFKFVGNGKGSLFVGRFKNQTTFSTNSNVLVALGQQNPNIQSTSVKNKGGIVPGLEGKLGLAYEFCLCRNSMWRLEAGYQAQIFINAIRSIDMGSEVALAALGSIGSAVTGVYARSFDRTVSDFGLAGPYITLDAGF